MVTDSGTGAFYLGEMRNYLYNGYITYYFTNGVVQNACDTANVDNFSENVAPAQAYWSYPQG